MNDVKTIEKKCGIRHESIIRITGLIVIPLMRPMLSRGFHRRHVEQNESVHHGRQKGDDLGKQHEEQNADEICGQKIGHPLEDFLEGNIRGHAAQWSPALWALLVWETVALLVLLWLAVGWVHALRLRARCVPKHGQH